MADLTSRGKPLLDPAAHWHTYHRAIVLIFSMPFKQRGRPVLEPLAEPH